MDTLTAFMMGEMNRGKEMKVFNWDAAAAYIKEHDVKEVMAGLEEDWVFTAGTIFENDEPTFDNYTYLASTWATPVLEVFTDETSQTIPCWCWEHECEWDAHTKWPQSALNLLK